MQETPRTKYQKILSYGKKQAEESLLTDLTMNFDPFTISLLKQEFENHNNSINLEQFINIITKHIMHWGTNLPKRDKLLVKLLNQLFSDIDLNGNNELEWEEFTNYIIDKATILKNSNNNRMDAVKEYKAGPIFECRFKKQIDYIIDISPLDRIGIVEDYSDTVQFYNIENGQKIGNHLKIEPLHKMGVRIENSNVKMQGRIRIFHSIFIPDPDISVLLTSTNDGYIRAWVNNGAFFHSANFEGGIPLLESESIQKLLVWDQLGQQLFTAADDGKIFIWDIKGKRNKPVNIMCNGHRKIVTDIVSVPDMKIVFSCSQDKQVIMWDMISFSPRRIFRAHSKGILNISFNKEQRLLMSAGFDHTIYVWTPYMDKPVMTIDGHNASLVKVMAIPKTQQIVSIDISGQVKVWDIRNMQCVQSFNVEDRLKQMKFSISEFVYIEKYQRLMFGGRMIMCYDYDKTYFPQFIDDYQPIGAYYTNYTNKIITVTSRRVKIWSALTGFAENIFAGDKEREIVCCQIDDWHKRVIIGDNVGVTQVYNVKNGVLIKTLQAHEQEVVCIKQSSELEIIVTVGQDNQIFVHDDSQLSDTSIKGSAVLAYSIITQIELVSYLGIILIGRIDGSINICDIETMYIDIGKINSEQQQITALQAITPYPIFASCNINGTIQFWTLHPLPYKSTCICTVKNFYFTKIAAVISTTFNENTNTLYTGDERGCVKQFELNPMIDYLGIPKLYKEFKKNKMLQIVHDPNMPIPHYPSKNLKFQHQLRLHNNWICNLSIIQNPPTILTCSFDYKVKLVCCDNMKVVGALQQGQEQYKQGKIIQDIQLIPWDFYLDLDYLKRQEKELKENLTKNVQVFVPMNKIGHYKQANTYFKNPHYISNLSKALEPEHYSQQYQANLQEIQPYQPHKNFIRNHSKAQAQRSYMKLNNTAKYYRISKKGNSVNQERSFSNNESIISQYKKRQKEKQKVNFPQLRRFMQQESLNAYNKEQPASGLSQIYLSIHPERKLRRKLNNSYTKSAKKLADLLDKNVIK